MSLARLMLLSLTLVVTGCGSGGDTQRGDMQRGDKPREATRPPAVTKNAAPVRPSRVVIPSGEGALSVMARKAGLTLRAKPNGKVIAHLKPTSRWDSPTVVWAVARKGRWLGVLATALGNNRIGWLDVQHDRPRMWRSPLSLEADLSERRLVLKRGSRVLRRMVVGIGGQSSPTPTGRFSVTDKLIPGRNASYYGCCVLALSGHQPVLRPGWAGGDRIAIHGGGKVGEAASAGCLRAPDAELKRLMKLLPVGTPVVIRA